LSRQPSSQADWPAGATLIYRRPAAGAADFAVLTAGDPAEELVGYLDAGSADGAASTAGSSGHIYRLRWGEAQPIGRFDAGGAIYRTTAHGEREVGGWLETGAIQSAGVLEGGEQGWMEPDGIVIQAGMILGEQEVGRVEGPNALAAAAALLLLFLPEDAELDRRAAQRS
jgi:hypothetical protein